MNPLIRLKKLGQSVWYDNLRKGLVLSGELKRMMEDYGLSGVTSNPTIFEKSISGTNEYDDDIRNLVAEGLGAEEIIRRLMVKDIRLAADVMAPVHRETGGRDGFVSIEVSPALASDAEATIKDARLLNSLIRKPNVMVKIPATAEGLPAIEQCVYEGLNINVTLLFSVKRYEEVAYAYIRGLERRAEEGLPVDGISSVASFFVSRVDNMADRIIEERISLSRSNDEKARLKHLLGKLAAANAKAAYRKFIEIFEQGERFRKLSEEGAFVQRLLWASTGAKNPAYSDIKYVEGLIQPGTVNTMPLQTMLAFYDHGRIGRLMSETLDEAGAVFSELESLGMDYGMITSRLEEEGLEKFSRSFKDLAECVMKKKAALLEKKGAVEFALNGFESSVAEAVEVIESEGFLKRLWSKDPTLWKKGPEEKRLIRNALGWLGLPELMDEKKEDIKGFAESVRSAGFTNAVLLGMGGSSLAPLVMKNTFGRAPGFPDLLVLDSTDPGAVSGVEERIDLKKTLFIVSSKSGSTIEPLSLFEYFYGKAHAVMGENAGGNFIAITDHGTPLEGFSKKYGFRQLFLNPHDIGGRFSALSYFGLVPAALMGIDISKLLYYASCVSAATQPETHAVDNPVIMLGAALGILGKTGRDKVTFFLAPEFSTFGLWIEQLLAESTGKEGKGLVPISNEPLGAPEDYGADRVFVSISLGEQDKERARMLKALSDAGHPVISFRLTDIYELGGEFLRWEVATSVAGQVLGINPFDQPDVELSKKLTTARLQSIGTTPLIPPGVEVRDDGLSVFFGGSTFDRIKGLVAKDGDLMAALGEFLKLIHDGDYLGVLAYYDPSDAGVEGEFAAICKALRERTGAATQFGFGPRYLHSTGQLHKGGPNKGVFIIFTHGPDKDVRIPRSAFSFSELELSQAFGDMDALESRGCRVALFNMRDGSLEALKQAESFLKSAAGPRH
ncbi:MAG: bifunctional transaldolase/phosoglucose isomerase [Deltaproteobacteria bacterium]|nr:bifunctional transaldolase/phosoglucose isomerase [Deltaproteobacteria bacterium]